MRWPRLLAIRQSLAHRERRRRAVIDITTRDCAVTQIGPLAAALVRSDDSASRRHLVLPQRPGARHVAAAARLFRFLERRGTRPRRRPRAGAPASGWWRSPSSRRRGTPLPGSISPTMVAPWPRISTTVLSPSVSASALPSGAVRISMSVMPPASRISKIGTPQPRKPHMCDMGRSFAPLAVPNGNERTGVAMHDRHHVGAHLVDLAMDEALAVLRLVGMRERVAVEVEGDDVLRASPCRAAGGATSDSCCGSLVVPHADVPEGIDDVETEQDLVGEHEVVEQGLGGFGEAVLAGSSASLQQSLHFWQLLASILVA